MEQLMESITSLNYNNDKSIKNLAKRLYNTNISYNSTYTLSLSEFQNMWISFYYNAEESRLQLRPSSKLVIYNRQDTISGGSSTGKWLGIPIIFNVDSKSTTTLQHISATKLEPITAKTMSTMFRVDLSKPELYNNRKYYFCEGCLYLRPRLRMLFGDYCYPNFNWTVDKYVLVKQQSSRSATSRIYDDIDTISGLFNESPKLTDLK